MLSVDQALALVLERCPLLPSRMSLADESLGLVLAETISSDIDSPPHDKSIVDGFAVVAGSCTCGTELQVIEEVTAGRVPTRIIVPGTATQIMTGAPLPAGADAVVMVEQTSYAGGGRVRIDASAVKRGQNIMRRAASLTRGQPVLAAGTRLRGIELGLLAEVGRTQVQVYPRPSLAIIATGDELVPCDQVPEPGQIRNSNSSLLLGLANQAGAVAGKLGIAYDNAVNLRGSIDAGLRTDVLVLSGGVSAGVLDLVPQVLAELGVEQVLHKVNLKPGKPLWFGVKRHSHNGTQTLVFGLPGNPVSSLVCFELFVRPAIQKLSGRAPTGLSRERARLMQDHQQRGERPTYWPAAVKQGDETNTVTPLPWKGSGDLATLAGANCLAFFPAGDRLFKAGESIEVLHLPG